MTLDRNLRAQPCSVSTDFITKVDVILNLMGKSKELRIDLRILIEKNNEKNRLCIGSEVGARMF